MIYAWWRSESNGEHMRLISITLLSLMGCGDTVTHIHHHYDVDPTPGGEAPPEPPVAATTTPDALRLDL